jgi:hypothetical protein
VFIFREKGPGLSQTFIISSSFAKALFAILYLPVFCHEDKRFAGLAINCLFFYFNKKNSIQKPPPTSKHNESCL